MTGAPEDVATGLNTVEVGLGTTCGAMLAMMASWNVGCSGSDDWFGFAIMPVTRPAAIRATAASGDAAPASVTAQPAR